MVLIFIYSGFLIEGDQSPIVWRESFEVDSVWAQSSSSTDQILSVLTGEVSYRHTFRVSAVLSVSMESVFFFTAIKTYNHIHGGTIFGNNYPNKVS